MSRCSDYDRLVGSYGDWRDDLQSQGYAVLKGVIEPQKARYYQEKALEWLKSFDSTLDLDQPSTWKTADLPVQTILNTYENYGVVHERFMWEARMEHGV